MSTMRIVTWNVLGLTGYPRDVAAEAIGATGTATNCAHFAEVFHGLNTDVLALQEGVTHPVARDIARRCAWHLASFPSPQSWPGHVLSRFPIVESRTFSHAVADDRLPRFSRTAGAALLQVSADEQLWVVCVHLHPADVALRALEGELLRERLEGLLPVCDNVVVLGDFNCDVSEAVHQHLGKLCFLNAMATAGGGLQLTMDTADINPWKIDHIYVSAALGSTLASAAVIRDPGFRTDPPRPAGAWDHSDHLPVRAELNWP
jgi:endonuclease/exonuclease/phosphatase family metal-dependent hydrolase